MLTYVAKQTATNPIRYKQNLTGAPGTEAPANDGLIIGWPYIIGCWGIIGTPVPDEAQIKKKTPKYKNGFSIFKNNIQCFGNIVYTFLLDYAQD